MAGLPGDASLATACARAALHTVERKGWTDWRLASALEGMGDEYAARCRDVLATIDDAEDRELIAGQLTSVPGLDES